MEWNEIIHLPIGREALLVIEGAASDKNCHQN